MTKKLYYLTALLLCSLLSGAEIRLPAIISDNMILQEDKEAQLWGWADSGSMVKAVLSLPKGKILSAQAEADNEGRFSLFINTQGSKGTTGKITFTIDGRQTHIVKNVLIGDLWLASGQSNMAWKVERTSTKTKDIAEANFPEIRFFYVPRSNAKEAKEDYQHIAPVIPSWKICSPQSVSQFSAVAYHFARSLHLNKKIPVGIIECAWGGSVIEAWLSKESLNSQEDLRKSYNQWQQKFDAYYKENKTQRFDIVDQQIKTILKKGGEHPINLRKPSFGWDYTPQHRFTYLYNSMYKPVAKASIKGVIWYQGESNCRNLEDIPRYIPAFKLLVDQYRKNSRNDQLPVFWVSLAGFEPSKKHMRTWSQFRAVQTALTSLPFSGQALAIDVGSKKNVHPSDKTAVGERLSRCARAIAYKENVIYEGPKLQKVSTNGSEVTLSFVNIGEKLSIKNKPYFEIAADDEVYKVANIIRYDKNSITLSCDSVLKPEFIRYNYRGFPGGHLYNSSGLPAVPFQAKNQ